METSIARKVREKIDRGGSRLWRVSDFSPMPARAVARELSRMEKKGDLRRIRKGLYKKPRVKISDTELVKSWSKEPLHPSRQSAAHMLSLAPKPRRATYATSASGAPEIDAHVITRRPKSRRALSPEDGALLEFIRDRGEYSTFPAPKTQKVVLDILQAGAWKRIFPHIVSEPPRSRAILGALGEEIGVDRVQLFKIKRTLNELSNFEFGKFSSLKYAKSWQAK